MIPIDCLFGYSGLAIAFIVLSAIIMWVIYSIKGKVLLKTLLTVFVVWYSAVLLFSIQNLSGWPTSTTLENMRAKSDLYILSIQVRPPDKKDPKDRGLIHFWTVVYGQEDVKFNILDLVNPSKAFDYKYKTDPRAYKIPYDKELHKEIIKKSKQKNKMRGSLMVLKKGKKKNKGKKSIYKQNEDKSKFKIINPFEVMKK